jgi:hypothetical protein
MGKSTKKLLVYLDQNFLSEMSKADLNEKVRPEFSDIYELLHQGFLDEKLVVPSSLLHDIESSLATHLKDRIKSYQHYLGQVRLRRPDEIREAQVQMAWGHFSGRENGDFLDPEIAFIDQPDQRTKQIDISVDAHWEQFNFRQTRSSTAQELEMLRQHCVNSKVSYKRQLSAEREAQKQELLKSLELYSCPLPNESRDRFDAFTSSPEFAKIPLLRVEAHLYATILTRMPTRQIKPSDTTDIDVLSAYAPYMDVICTDAFMADQLSEFTKEYGVKVFHGKTTSLRQMRTFLEGYLRDATPACRPSITAFVLPPKDGREKSFDFFFQLGKALRAMGTGEYGEIYAFDDGAMPRYELRQTPDVAAPFYGLQDVTPIPLSKGISEEEILKICDRYCRSDYYVLIDTFNPVPEDFMLGAAMCAEINKASIRGYRLFKKNA